jgi:hypothetical protein
MIDAEKIAAVLADEDWTRRVVIAAAKALDVLNGPDLTVDGDDNRLPARSTLNTAFMDMEALAKVLRG